MITSQASPISLDHLFTLNPLRYASLQDHQPLGENTYAQIAGWARQDRVDNRAAVRGMVGFGFKYRQNVVRWQGQVQGREAAFNLDSSQGRTSRPWLADFITYIAQPRTSIIHPRAMPPSYAEESPPVVLMPDHTPTICTLASLSARFPSFPVSVTSKVFLTNSTDHKDASSSEVQTLNATSLGMAVSLFNIKYFPCGLEMIVKNVVSRVPSINSRWGSWHYGYRRAYSDSIQTEGSPVKTEDELNPPQLDYGANLGAKLELTPHASIAVRADTWGEAQLDYVQRLPSLGFLSPNRSLRWWEGYKTWLPKTITPIDGSPVMTLSVSHIPSEQIEMSAAFESHLNEIVPLSISNRYGVKVIQRARVSSQGFNYTLETDSDQYDANLRCSLKWKTGPDGWLGEGGKWAVGLEVGLCSLDLGWK